MKNTIRILVVSVCAFQISSCMMVDDRDVNGSYQNYTYAPTQEYYSQNTYPMMNTEQVYQSSAGAVSVPDSYHVGEFHSPVSFKDRDKNWVTNQNPMGYTIEIADDEKAAQVANKLYKAPKNDRMAQIKYQRNGKNYYKGVYGTYDSPEAAQKALDALPAEVKQGAGVKNWSSVQGNLRD